MSITERAALWSGNGESESYSMASNPSIVISVPQTFHDLERNRSHYSPVVNYQKDFDVNSAYVVSMPYGQDVYDDELSPLSDQQNSPQESLVNDCVINVPFDQQNDLSICQPNTHFDSRQYQYPQHQQVYNYHQQQ